MSHQPVDVKSWIDTSCKSICAPSGRINASFDTSTRNGPTLLQHVAKEIYPSLLEAGYEIPLNLAADLTYLYLEGVEAQFKSRWDKKGEPPWVPRYCSFLKGEIEDGRPLRRVLTTVKRVQRQRLQEQGAKKNGRGKILTRDTLEAAGLITFLELCARSLLHHPNLIDPPAHGRVPNGVREVLKQGNLNPSLSMLRNDPTATAYLNFFFESIFPDRPTAQTPSFEEIFKQEENVLLMLSSTRVPAGAEGLDLPLLQGCLNYEPLRLSKERAERYQRLRRTLSLRDSSSSRSPECGNFGVTTKGNPTTVLRSYLAREDFVERVYLNQVLYFQRYAPQLEPHPVLFVWVIDRGRLMQVRQQDSDSQGRRRDSVARQLMACLIEDTVRHFHSLYGITLRVAVLMHDGKERTHSITLPPEVLSQAPALDTTSEIKVTWLPKVDGFLPEYFLREPVWSAMEGKTPTTIDDTQKEQSYWECFRWVSGLADRLDLDFAEVGNTFFFDLCHVAVFGPQEKLMSGAEVQDSASLQQYFAGLAATTTFSFFSFGNDEISWTVRPKPAHVEAPIVRKYTGQTDELRQKQWDYLVGLLQSL